LRNRFGYALSDRLISPINKTLNEYRRTWGLAELRSPDDSFSRLAQLCQMPREFDFPRCNLSPVVNYVGPFIDSGPGLQTPPFPFERIDGRPLIYASFGTLQPGALVYFERIAEACSPLDVQVVITTGNFAGEMPRFAGNTIAVRYAPQLELLSRAALTITHAGLNTTMQSLYFGVPMVAIPMTHDQPAIAARIAWTGCGLVVPPRGASVPRLREAIKSALSGPNYRAAARTLQDAIRRAGGVEGAVDIVEQFLRNKQTSDASGNR
jgi:MGT family glycosyltransferase